MKTPTYNDDPRWWCGSCVKCINGIMNLPPLYCVCYQEEIKKRIKIQTTLPTGSILECVTHK